MSNNLVYKSNQFALEQYTMTANEAKLLTMVVSEIKKDDKKFSNVLFKGAELLKKLGLGENNYKDLKKLTEKIMSRVIKFDNVQNEEGKEHLFSQRNFFKGCDYYIKNNIAYVDVLISDDMKPYYLELKKKLNYFWYRLEYIMQFTSQYSFRIYELIKKNNYNSKSRVNNFTIEIKELRKMLVLEKKYKLFGHFKQFILEVTTLEITALSDMVCTYEPLKIDSRSYTHIKFYFETKDEETQKIKNYKLSKAGLKKIILLSEKSKNREQNIVESKNQLEQMQKESEMKMKIKKLEWENEYLRLYPTPENQKYVTLESFIDSKMRGK